MDPPQAQNHAYTILRIKRKRTEEPLDALGMRWGVPHAVRCSRARQSSRRAVDGKSRAAGSTCSSLRRLSSKALGKTRR